MPDIDGIFNVNKPKGLTSHDVVTLVRRLAKQRKVGHAGTLDPAAEGVLLVCLGKATKVVEYLTEHGKAYRADVTFGVSTDTYDAEGQVTRRKPVGGVTLPDIERVLARFRGTITQVPPRYSAIKQAGQPLYKLARAGKHVLPPPREVTIHRLEVESWQAPVLTVFVACSKGTYIRSLAHELGEALGCGAHLSGLVRLASGRFDLATASTIETLTAAFEEGTAGELIFALDEALLDYNAVIIGPSRASAVRNGMSWKADQASLGRAVGEKGPVRVYSVEGEIVAMATYDSHGERWQPTKVF